MTTELGERILKVLEENPHKDLDATTILDILEVEYPGSIPRYKNLYDVNEFFELEESQQIMWDSDYKCWRLRD